MSPRRGAAPAGDTLRTLQDGAAVVVRRSSRRTRTVAAFWEDGQAVVAIPAHFNRTQETEWVTRMVEKLHRQGRKPTSGKGSRRAPNDAALAEHAAGLSQAYLGGRAVPTSVRWVRNQNSRWGSATPSEGTIRLSHKLQPMPQWVIDYVLLHELAHLLVAGHNAAFWKLLEAYPHTERAKAFLEGVSFATARGMDQATAEGETEDGPTEGGPVQDADCGAG
ncbi:M48 family metallopeptidase [Pseudarthrobacter sp. J64]|uniref:M48 metallopeptidase family protein n=1 Tax=Pseudarthrobacter sp. J64 TaxID=3116485 RepID=UPI002E81EDB7|nr:M48 family metallopeptidase [Pseudarthrobacter sp. J64]MEE2568262.1 M48 family metallopeptidase [Pseudarthrobacter sp. J64]